LFSSLVILNSSSSNKYSSPVSCVTIRWLSIQNKIGRLKWFLSVKFVWERWLRNASWGNNSSNERIIELRIFSKSSLESI